MDLTEFLSASPLSLKVLTVESSIYLPQLRELFPKAKLFGITKHTEVINYPQYQNLNVYWTINDNVKIFPQDYFDIILAESVLNDTKNSYEDLMTISRALKDTGYFLGSFLNLRYAPILDELKEGRFPFRDEHLYAKDEVVKMLNDAVFKEIVFMPAAMDDENENTASSFAKAGFENYQQDLSTKIWMFKASRATASVAALKELYTKDTRKKLSRLLLRIEYDVNREENLALLWKLIDEERIFPDYLLGFMEEISIHKNETIKILLKSAKIRGLEDFASGMDEAMR